MHQPLVAMEVGKGRDKETPGAKWCFFRASSSYRSLLFHICMVMRHATTAKIVGRSASTVFGTYGNEDSSHVEFTGT